MSLNKKQLSKGTRAANAHRAKSYDKQLQTRMHKPSKSELGYRDDSPYRNEPYIDVFSPNGIIDMQHVGIPILANGVPLSPYSGQYQFPTSQIREIPLAQRGGAYDLEAALAAGFRPDSTGHMQSRLPLSGRVLKRPSHPTFWKGIDADRALGYMPMMDPRGEIYTISPSDLPREGYFAPMEMELTDEEIEEYRKGGYVVEDYYQEGGVVSPGDGWEYQKKGDQYFTRRAGTNKWIAPTGYALESIKRKIFDQAQPMKVKPGDTQSIKDIQRKLVAAGYNLGAYGETKDGVDGKMGPLTQSALSAYNAGISPQKNNAQYLKKREDAATGTTTTVKDPETLEDGFLPILSGYGQEGCSKKGGCSYNASKKLSDIMAGSIKDVSALWTEDAWFNKDRMIKDGGSLIYSTDERNYNRMPEVPAELYSKLQVGDYVHLNREDTQSSAEFTLKKHPDNLKNEGIEHIGFIIGKDEDGTPLVWHGSETGKAYVQKLSESLTLKDLGLKYKVSSIVRNPEMKNLNDETSRRIQNSAYYRPYKEDLKVVPSDNATDAQKKAIGHVNDNMKKFKNLGYDQEEIAMVGHLLVGGIMQMESQGDESLKRGFKQLGAYMMKDLGMENLIPDSTPFLGSKKSKFEGDVASWGVYQLKDDLHFKDLNTGKPNRLGRKLEDLGVPVDAIFDSLENQTIAGQLILLDNYQKLKRDPKWDDETKTFAGKLPASYVLAKSWQAGSGWQNREHYKEWIDSYDVTYSENALDSAANTARIVNGTYNIGLDLSNTRMKKYGIDLEDPSKVVPIPMPDPRYSSRDQTYIDQPMIRPAAMPDVEPAPRPIGVYAPDIAPRPFITSIDPQFDSGGAVMELDEAEIEEYKKRGFVVEEYQEGGNAPTTADSLALYNNALRVQDYYRKNPAYRVKEPRFLEDFPPAARKMGSWLQWQGPRYGINMSEWEFLKDKRRDTETSAESEERFRDIIAKAAHNLVKDPKYKERGKLPFRDPQHLPYYEKPEDLASYMVVDYSVDYDNRYAENIEQKRREEYLKELDEANKQFKKKQAIDPGWWDEFRENDAWEKGVIYTNEGKKLARDIDYRNQVSDYQFAQREVENMALDLEAPKQLFDRRIPPHHRTQYYRVEQPGKKWHSVLDTRFGIPEWWSKATRSDSVRHGRYNKGDLYSKGWSESRDHTNQRGGYDFGFTTGKDDPLKGDLATVHGYDPLQIKPVYMLTPEERKLRDLNGDERFDDVRERAKKLRSFDGLTFGSFMNSGKKRSLTPEEKLSKLKKGVPKLDYIPTKAAPSLGYSPSYQREINVPAMEPDAPDPYLSQWMTTPDGGFLKRKRIPGWNRGTELDYHWRTPSDLDKARLLAYQLGGLIPEPDMQYIGPAGAVMELTDDEIEEYRQGGYIVEELNY